MFCFCLVVGTIFQLWYTFTGETWNFFLLIHTMFFALFVVFLCFAEYHVQFRGWSTWVKTYFNLLDNQLGKGMYHIFLCLLLIEIIKPWLIILVIPCFIIGIINIILGWDTDKSNILPSFPWKSENKRSDMYQIGANNTTSLAIVMENGGSARSGTSGRSSGLKLEE